MASFWEISIKASLLPTLEGTGPTNKNTLSKSLCELSPTPLCEVCEKSKLGLTEILFVST
jgi:hypothetical protein